MSEIKEQPEEEQPQEETSEGNESHVLGEVAGGVCLACTMISCLSLFFVAMVGIA